MGNITLYINDGNIYNKTIDIKFNSVYPNKSSKFYNNLVYSDYRIGVMDLETYKDEYDISRVYAIGYYANKKLETFYISKDYDSDNLIIQCLDSILKESYNNYTFYLHNFGNYDAIFMLKVILDNPNKYIYKPEGFIMRDGRIFCLTIAKKVGNKTFTIKLVKSYFDSLIS